MEVSCLSSGAGQKRGCPARPRAWTGRTTPSGPSMGCMASDGPPPAPIKASPRPPGPVPSNPPSRHLAGAADLTGPLCAEAGNRPPWASTRDGADHRPNWGTGAVSPESPCCGPRAGPSPAPIRHRDATGPPPQAPRPRETRPRAAAYRPPGRPRGGRRRGAGRISGSKTTQGAGGRLHRAAPAASAAASPALSPSRAGSRPEAGFGARLAPLPGRPRARGR